MSDVLQTVRVSVFADYFQFYLEDGKRTVDFPTDWTSSDVDDRMKQASTVVVVSPVRNMNVPVEVQVHNSEPTYDLDAWDHIAETSLDVSTGSLRITEVASNHETAKIEVSPGIYRVRACFGKLDSLSDNGLEGDDYYVVQLWKGTHSPVHVLKRWVEHVG
jgi:hypothetical protein